jgi:hypothetical protein
MMRSEKKRIRSVDVILSNGILVDGNVKRHPKRVSTFLFSGIRIIGRAVVQLLRTSVFFCGLVTPLPLLGKIVGIWKSLNACASSQLNNWMSIHTTAIIQVLALVHLMVSILGFGTFALGLFIGL